MSPEHLTRQSELIRQEVLDTEIVIVGAGAIGSFTTLTLAKMGFRNITVYDFDTIDPENMNCQFYRLSDIGKKKVDALRHMVGEFAGVDIKCHDQKVEGVDVASHILITAVDSMGVRKDLFEQAKYKHYLDARMAAEYIKMYYVNPEEERLVKSYSKSLYSDSDAVAERCTAKSTMYTVNLIAGLMGKAVKDIVNHKAPIESLDWGVGDNSAVWFTQGKKGTL